MSKRASSAGLLVAVLGAGALLAGSTPQGFVATVPPCTDHGFPAPCGRPPIDVTQACVGVEAERAALGTMPPANVLHRVTIQDPEATCNDGSPAIMYVRPAQYHRPGGGGQGGGDGGGGWAQFPNDWLIVLEGGGTAFHPSSLDEGMHNRWTGLGSNGAPQALACIGKMSTDFRDANSMPGRDGVIDRPLRAVVDGVLKADESFLGGWNLVLLNYCSSDSWMGRESALILDQMGPFHGRQGFRIDFNGRRIFKAAIQMLKNPGWLPDQFQRPQGFPPFVMNDLDNARRVVLAGASAGGAGVLNNLDWLANHVPASARTYGTVGSSHLPPIGSPADDWWVDVSPVDGVSDIQAFADTRQEQVGRINGFFDFSCRNDLPDTEHTQCLLLSSAVDHISTPLLVQQDSADSLLRTRYDCLAVNNSNPYWAGLMEDYDTWQGGPVSYFSAYCGNHADLTSRAFFDNYLLNPTGDPCNYNIALWMHANDMSVHAAHGQWPGPGAPGVWITDPRSCRPPGPPNCGP